MALPGDVVKMVEGFANDYVQNVVLYFLNDEHEARLHTHVYRANGVIEAKKNIGREMAQPFHAPTALALQSFVTGVCPWQYTQRDHVVVVYRGESLPPMDFRTPDQMVCDQILKHFKPVVQEYEHMDELAAADSEVDPVARFGEYAWDILDQKNDS